MAFYQKYRPKTFSELLGEDHISRTLLEAVKSGKLSHAYLLSGPRGTGKTSTARLLAKAFNCQALNEKRKKGEEISGEPCNECESCREIAEGRSIDIIEIDAASHTKVDEIREVIDKATFAPNKSLKKVYIIDEVHMLSNSSFNALLKTLEEPPNHVVFILATTEVQKLPATILSRTQRYDFKRVAKDDIVRNLKQIAKKEKIEIDDSSLDLIAVNAEGGHRDAIGLLEKVASVSHTIKKSDVLNILGIAESKEIFDFLGAIFNADSEEGLKIAHRLYQNGVEMNQLIKEALGILRKIMICKMSGETLFEDTEENLSKIKGLSGLVDTFFLIKCIEIFIKSGQLLKEVSLPLLPVEMAIIETCTLSAELEISKSKFLIPASPAGRSNQTSNSKIQKKHQTIEHKDKEEEKPEIEIKEELAAKTQEPKTPNSQLPTPNSDLSATEKVSVIQMTDDLWQRVIEIVKKDNATLSALLRDAKPLEIDSEKVVLGVRFPFHKDKISEPKNTDLLENVFSELTGGKCVVSCKISNNNKKREQSSLNDDDLQKAAEEIFA